MLIEGMFKIFTRLTYMYFWRVTLGTILIIDTYTMFTSNV